jgi:hypothetical protein
MLYNARLPSLLRGTSSEELDMYRRLRPLDDGVSTSSTNMVVWLPSARCCAGKPGNPEHTIIWLCLCLLLIFVIN